MVDVANVRRWTGSAWTAVSFVKRWTGSAWVQVWPLFGALTATLSPTTLSTIDAGVPATKLITSSNCTCTPHDGSGGAKTYSWTRVSGSTAITPNSASSSVTSFSATVSKGTSVDAVFKCTVDDGTYTADSDTVSVHLQYDAI